MKNKLFKVTLLAVLTAIQVPIYAVETGVEWLKISGFGTVTAAHANIPESETAYFSPSTTSPKGVNESWSARTDSRLGVQAEANVNSSLSGMIQVVSKYNHEGNFRPAVTWANMKYTFNPDISVRVGRMGLPAFLISDYFNVGYSQPWIRPPVEAYKSMPTTYVDGADAIFRFHGGETTISIQPAIGSSSYWVAANGNNAGAKVKNIRALNIVAERDAFTLRYGNVHEESDNPQVGLFGVVDNFNNIGLIYDQDAWLVQGEYIWRKTSTDAFLGNFNSSEGYITAGYRIGKFMPNITFSRYLDSSTLNLLTTQNTTSAGVRWDFYKNMALKAQVDHVERSSSSAFGTYPGLFSTENPFSTFVQNNKSVNVFSIGVDFVF